MDGTAARDALQGAGITRGKIDDAITAWRNGATYNAIHPLANAQCGALWDDDYVKDLARVDHEPALRGNAPGQAAALE